ncbi:RlpA-like double-psi beta-barrel-protein domain-containing protein-containing protein [Lactifluus volemus]|nr:RlpA-like double-psi beta-barrel-protein domain-containing protein-containing protein [Lactifluus volemus]
MTHYTLPENYIASCGCTAESTHYPTAALNAMAFGSRTGYGPACGRCFELTLLNSFLSNPPFYPTTKKSVVIKITDLCPLSTTGWCNATTSGPNAGGSYLNFDLAFPSHQYPDFGVWNISYQSVSCASHWSGSKDAAALGSDPSLGNDACCAADPTGSANDTCTSYSDKNGTPPNTANSSAASARLGVSIILTWIAALIIPLTYTSSY